jgi:hypothetical protein
LDAVRLRELTDDDPLVGTPVRHFAAWGGIDATLPDLAPARLAALD